MAPNKRSSDSSQPLPTGKKSRKSSGLPAISWTADESFLTWRLLGEIEKAENFKVLFGKRSKHENTSGERKTTVYKRIGHAMLPDLYDQEPATVGDRVKSKVESLISTYRTHSKKLCVTGGGLKDSDDQSPSQEASDEYMEFYIKATGPDAFTTATARNLWEQIEDEFPFFPRLHAILAARPNVNPIAITTGVGPQGRKTVYYQAPDSYEGSPADQSTTDDENIAESREWKHQYNNLLEAIAAASACTDPLSTSSESFEGHSVTETQLSTSTIVEPICSSSVQAATHSGISGADKENAAPSTTSQRSQKVKSRASELLEQARLSIKRIPPKPTLEETLVQVQRENLQYQQTRANEELVIKKRTLLMEEFKCYGSKGPYGV